MFEPINLSCYANAEIDALVSGPGRPLESTPIFLDFVEQAQGPLLEYDCQSTLSTTYEPEEPQN